MAFFFLEEVVDSLSDALITVDQNRKVIIWNEMAKRMFGYDKAEIQQMGLEAIIPPAYLQRHREAYGRFVEHIDARNSFVSKIKQFEALRNTGELFPIELTHSMLKLNNEEYYITVLIRDITLRKHYEIMRDRLDRITHHDLKNKLAIIALAAKRLISAAGTNENEQIDKYVEIIRSESTESIELLNSTRELILLETGEYRRRDETIDLVKLVRLKTEQAQPLAVAKGVSILFQDKTPGKVVLHADRSLLERALENLIKNAIEAEDPFGTVELILEENERGAPILKIHNGGKPIPEDLQKQIFSPYVTHGKKEGVGLGLYSTKLILESIHGWRISFQSGSQGTIFQVTFG